MGPVGTVPNNTICKYPASKTIIFENIAYNNLKPSRTRLDTRHCNKYYQGYKKTCSILVTCHPFVFFASP